MGFLTRCKRPFLFAFLLQFCNMLFSFFLKTFLILFEKQHGEREYGVPARSYYETIARGYADAGFDIGVLNEAVQESVRRMLDEMDPEEEMNETWQMML